jgi:predicted N-acetyltransferase YhbS
VTASGWQIRPLTASDDLEAELDLNVRAFGPALTADRAEAIAGLEYAIADGRMFGVFDGPALIGSAKFHPMRQWWHGRSLAMAGVGGVKVAPERRGQGVGTALTAELLAEIGRRGYPVSVLYPATASVYRSLGWELAGAHYETRLPTHLLGPLLHAEYPSAPDVSGPPGCLGPASRAALRRAGPDDAEEIVSVIGAAHAALRDCGTATRAVPVFRHWLTTGRDFCYLADDGFLSYHWASGHDQIVIDRAVAASQQTARAFWGVVASHASMASTVRAYLAPDDPVSWLLKDGEPDLVHRRRWMLRLVDPAAAIAARGFPPVAEVTAALRLDDKARPDNSGLWRLTVGAGTGSLSRFETAAPGRIPATSPLGRGARSPLTLGARSPLTLGARGLAAMYAGIPMAVLRRSGLADGGDPAADPALDCAFAAQAFMADYF